MKELGRPTVVFSATLSCHDVSPQAQSSEADRPWTTATETEPKETFFLFNLIGVFAAITEN